MRVLLRDEVTEALGDKALEAVTVVDHRTGEHRDLAVRALFVFTARTLTPSGCPARSP